MAVLSDATISRSAVYREDLKPYWKSVENHIFLRDKQSNYLQVFKTLLTKERRLTGWDFLAVDLFPTFLNTRTTDDNSQQSRLKDSFKKLL